MLQQEPRQANKGIQVLLSLKSTFGGILKPSYSLTNSKFHVAFLIELYFENETFRGPITEHTMNVIR